MKSLHSLCESEKLQSTVLIGQTILGLLYPEAQSDLNYILQVSLWYGVEMFSPSYIGHWRTLRSQLVINGL